MTKISAVIITKNEEQNIRRCLESVTQVTDKIIVVDSHSTDNTVSICREYQVEVFQLEWKGYAHAKNFGIGKTNNDYILSIDADEVLSEPLIHSIQRVKEQMTGAFSFNRLSNYCGQWIHHCGWYPDRKLRIFPKNKAQWSGDLLHYSFRSLSDHIQRVDRYSRLAAEELVQKNEDLLYLKLIVLPVFKFIKSYLLQGGFIDGFLGFCICSISGFDVFLRYAKAIHLKRMRVISPTR